MTNRKEKIISIATITLSITLLGNLLLANDRFVSYTQKDIDKDYIPNSAKVISQNEIRESGYLTMEDVLSHIAGIDIISKRYKGILPKFNMRGMKSADTLILIDGVPIYDSVIEPVCSGIVKLNIVWLS